MFSMCVKPSSARAAPAAWALLEFRRGEQREAETMPQGLWQCLGAEDLWSTGLSPFWLVQAVVLKLF